jgi:hypothetical protein
MPFSDSATGWVSFQEGMAAMSTLTREYSQAVARAVDLLVTHLEMTPEQAVKAIYGEDGIIAIDKARDTICAVVEVMSEVSK